MARTGPRGPTMQVPDALLNRTRTRDLQAVALPMISRRPKKRGVPGRATGPARGSRGTGRCPRSAGLALSPGSPLRAVLMMRGLVAACSPPFHVTVAPPAATTFCAQFVRIPHGSPIMKMSFERVGIRAMGTAYALPDLRPTWCTIAHNGSHRRPATSVASGSTAFASHRGGPERVFLVSVTTPASLNSSCDETPRGPQHEQTSPRYAGADGTGSSALRPGGAGSGRRGSRTPAEPSSPSPGARK